MKKERRWLINSIRSRLLPSFIQRGFEPVPIPKSKDGASDREGIASMPLGFLRKKIEHGFEQADVHLSGNGRASFTISFGVVPDAGMESAFGHIEAEYVYTTWLKEYFVLCARRRFFKPFAARRPWWSRREFTAADYDQLVDRVIALLPEVDEALKGRKVGLHIRRCG